VQQIATAVGEGAIAGLSIIKEGRKWRRQKLFAQ
jgi:thioredoxin reductase